MPFKKYRISEHKHYADGFNIGITFNDRIKFRACFTPDCLYKINSNDAYDINKLFGFSSSYSHHKQSARIGWRCINGEDIEIIPYTYVNSKRIIDDDVLYIIKPNEVFECEIIDLGTVYIYRFTRRTPTNIIKLDRTIKKQNNWFPFKYFLFPYFGGNLSAPHDMDIYIELM